MSIKIIKYVVTVGTLLFVSSTMAGGGGCPDFATSTSLGRCHVTGSSKFSCRNGNICSLEGQANKCCTSQYCEAKYDPGFCP